MIKLFQANVKLGQGTRAAKTQAIENLDRCKTKRKLKMMTKLAKRVAQII